MTQPLESHPIRLLDLTHDELIAQLAAWDQPAYRAGQLRQWLYKQVALDPAEMTNLPAALRGTSGRRKPDRAALTGDRNRLARWPNHQGPFSPARWPADRNRAHALQPAQYGVHQQPGRLRDGLHVLRHRQDGPAAQSDAGRDRGAGAVFRAVVEKRVARVARSPAAKRSGRVTCQVSKDRSQ